MISLTSGRMSKRAGNAVDLDDLVDDVGPDVMRLLSLHARIQGIGREAERRGLQRVPLAKADLALLAHERELELLRALSHLEEVITRACVDRAPHRLAGWVREFADHFHGFYHDRYVIHPDNTPQLTQSRLWLVEAARVGLAIALGLLGVAAPDTM